MENVSEILNANSDRLARISLECKAIMLNPSKPFRWASRYFMPIYNDNRLLLASAYHRRNIGNSFIDLMDAQNTRPYGIAGTSTAGIPHATTLADLMDAPLIYIRDKPKEHGMKNRIEGISAEKGLEGNEYILIEDLISTGGSSVSAVDAIRQAGGICNNCFSIFTYDFDSAKDMFEGKIPYDDSGCKLTQRCNVKSILTYEKLLEVAIETGYIKENEISLLKEWRENPFEWGANHGFPRAEK